MKWILPVIFLIVGHPSMAAKDTDSLWSRWTDESLADTLRYNALNTYYYTKYMRVDADSALFFAKKGLSFLKERGLDKQIGHVMNDIGQCYLNLGNMDSALISFQEGIQYSTREQDYKNLAALHINGGIVLNYLGRGKEALEQFDIGIEFCDKVGEFNYKMNALNNKGALLGSAGRYDEAIDVFKLVVEVASEKGYGSEAHVAGYVNLGYNLAQKGDHAQAIDYYDKCLKLIEKYNVRQPEYYVYNFLGLSSLDLGETDEAMKYFLKAYALAEKFGDPGQMAGSLNNMADIFANQGDRVLAREKRDEAYRLMKISNYVGGMLSALSSLAQMDLEENKLDSAEVKFNRALRLAREIDEIDQEAYVLAGLGLLAVKRGNAQQGVKLLNQSLEIGKEMGSLSLIMNASRDLANAYKILGDSKQALNMFEQFVIYRDSLESEDNKRAAIRQEYRYSYGKQALADSLEFAQKEAIKDLEIEKRDANLAKQQIGLVATGGGILLLILLALSIRKGKRRSDELLHNILPEQVATELKQKGKVGSKRIDSVTVLFTDFKGFTAMAEQLSAQELVEDLNLCFSAFDRIMEKYGIEKIKTIGDAYMAACGLPLPDEKHAQNVVKAAFEMRDFVEAGKAQKIEKGLPFFEIRIGVHTGPVVAGIVGVKKFQYDIWGDTVNIASRMESSGAVGKVNISQTTYERIKENPDFEFESRGKIEAKGKGEMEMYFVSEKT